MLSLQSGQVGFGGSLLGSGSFGLLNSLGGKEFLLHLLSFKLLGSLFFLELLKFSCSGLGKLLLVFSLLLGIADLLLKLLVSRGRARASGSAYARGSRSTAAEGGTR